MQHITKKPKPWTQLFENLFVKRRGGATLEAVSGGLIVILENATRLLEDATVLDKSNRFASSQFLITTAEEEMAKSYILLDACRLDRLRYPSVLRCLCHSFYDHIAKYAYIKVIWYPSLHNMEDVKKMWEVETTKWWPSEHDESGEPDMPHQTYFIRETPLYVDFGDYDQRWYEPEKDAAFSYKYDGKYRFRDAQEALERLQRTLVAGLYSPESLAILNDNFRKVYIKEDTPSERIQRLYEETAQEMETKLRIQKKEFFESALHEWPLYHFTTLPQSHE